MKRIIIPLMLGFGVTLALVIGSRLTADDMAVVLGVAVGVAASVPISILLVALVRRAQRAALPTAPSDPHVTVLPASRIVEATTRSAPKRLTDGRGRQP
jgi:hypothetical protein